MKDGYSMRSAPMNVVLLDDNVDVVDMMALVLQDRFPEAIFRVFSDSSMALDSVLQERPDVIVSDLEMPVMDGEALATAVRDSCPAGTAPLLVAVSGNGVKVQGVLINQLFDHSFVKPVDMERLVKLLEEQ